MSKIFKMTHPDTSRLWPMVQKGDFIDGYATPSQLSPQDALSIGLAMPKWADALLRLRNVIVRPLGLKTGSAKDGRDAIFPMHYSSDTEIIIGTDDAHLNFRISVLRQNGHLHMATWVHRNNWIGRVYLLIVMPFHVAIVRNAMRQIAKASTITSPPLAQ
ncbi:DUF2867 domain-containing protein [Celeribacter arenosi]|uniref:DUF2867 domain-containing protein n=1 Tax=Celeribacter arenosi TaxID=792649 RepID=A0ABP7JV15_9RHOB